MWQACAIPLSSRGATRANACIGGYPTILQCVALAISYQKMAFLLLCKGGKQNARKNRENVGLHLIGGERVTDAEPTNTGVRRANFKNQCSFGKM